MQGLGTKCNILELIETFQNISNKKIRYEILETAEENIEISCANIEKIEKELKWKQKETLKETCKNIWFYFER